MRIHFLANRAEIFSGNSENLNLSIAGVKSMLWHLIFDFDFEALFGLGPQNPTKNLAHVGILWVTCYLKIVLTNYLILKYRSYLLENV